MPVAVPAVIGTVVIPKSRIGFTAESATVGISGITIMERATPAL